MIAPRATRLVRVPDLRAFREAVAALACEGAPVEARDRLVVVPTQAAAAHLLRSIENRMTKDQPAVILPDLITPRELVSRLAERLRACPPVLSGPEREVLLSVACRMATEDGVEAPFRLRPGLVAEMLRFYDELMGNQKDVDSFERLTLGVLEPGAELDRGAARLVRQTRFLAGAFRRFERLSEAAGGTDWHRLRSRVIAETAQRPWRHVVLTVADRARDAFGLWPADWDLLARVPGLSRLDVVVTDSMLAGAFHERIHHLLPGIEEVREIPDSANQPEVLVPEGGGVVHSLRDREEEVAAFARWVRRSWRAGQVSGLDCVALVVQQPLPYVYLGREVLRSAQVPCQLFDALPLAAEPYAAALDLVLALVDTNFSRATAVALMRSPYFKFDGVSLGDTSALDRALSEQGFLGEHEALRGLVASWTAAGPGRRVSAGALRAGRVLLELAGRLHPLTSRAPAAEHLATLLAFLEAHQALPGPDDPNRARQLRARAAIVGTLRLLHGSYLRHDRSPTSFADVVTTVRRWIEGQTFAPRTGDAGVHVVDADSARFGDFDQVQLAGLVDGEWPDRPRRSIFYSPAILRELGWPSESERLAGVRSAFADLLRLPSSQLLLSAFALEEDTPVAASTLLDEVEASGLELVVHAADRTRVFEIEALGLDPVDLASLEPDVRAIAAGRLRALPRDAPSFRGQTAGHAAAAFSLSALERYQDCPFRFFAADVLRLEEAPEDEDALSPRERGRFVHEVFRRFFDEWDRTGGGAITSSTLDAARRVFEGVAAPALASLPEADAGLERARLFGSAIALGMVDVVLGLEASRPTPVVERWLERRFEGEFALGGSDGRRIALRGVADRVDLLEGDHLRVIDYKSGYPPDVKRALQVPVYALCAVETLADRDGRPWSVEEANYMAFSGRRPLVPVIRRGEADPARILTSARSRLLAVVDGVSGGVFPARPHDPAICGYCAYPTVCRKDYVSDD